MAATRTFRVTCTCMAWYTSDIQVPADYTLAQAIKYARTHISEIPITSGLEYITGSDDLDEENCRFEEVSGNLGSE